MLFSLVEALLILPAHLKHLDHRPRLLAPLLAFTERLQRPTVRLLDILIERTYRPFLKVALEWRYATVAVALAVLLLTIGTIASGQDQVLLLPAGRGRQPGRLS